DRVAHGGTARDRRPFRIQGHPAPRARLVDEGAEVHAPARTGLGRKEAAQRLPGRGEPLRELCDALELLPKAHRASLDAVSRTGPLVRPVISDGRTGKARASYRSAPPSRRLRLRRWPRPCPLGTSTPGGCSSRSVRRTTATAPCSPSARIRAGAASSSPAFAPARTTRSSTSRPEPQRSRSSSSG